eukprot:CAMPEP_0184456972 /NCGR_PEP_ID=MMETSP0740-20130409/28565_1 /TAXON_ID=385413 /ORGANISM="Thalassiosira miniscula, Strain CCMP1093" /LENGTH=52 /DNA_ID=CAMNT_0026829241 /DNA_START=15 /DNA_END=170 /DNA_ORIENTATION=-
MTSATTPSMMVKPSMVVLPSLKGRLASPEYFAYKSGEIAHGVKRYAVLAHRF